MNILVFITILGLSIGGIGFITFFVIFALDSMIRKHDLPTSQKAINAIAQTIKQYHPHARTFYDLGSGRGTLALGIKQRLPQLQVRGVDMSHFRIFVARVKSLLLHRKIQWLRQDIFTTNLSNADIVYTYLWYDTMPMLEQKLKRELPKNALIITNTSSLPTWPITATQIIHPNQPAFEKLFIHRQI